MAGAGFVRTSRPPHGGTGACRNRETFTARLGGGGFFVSDEPRRRAACSMLVAVLMIVGGLVLLYFGAEGLVRGAVALALRLGLTPLVVGLTVVAFGTSMPELVVSLGAALGGRDAIAVGNVVGSNLCNVALILGLSALLSPIRAHAQLLRFDVPLMIATCGLLLVLLLDGGLGRLEGAGLAAGLVAYALFAVWKARQERPKLQAEIAESLPATTLPLGRAVLYCGGGLGLLVLGAQGLVEGAVVVATALGVSEATIGLTVVAIGTSLPELATSVVAASRGEGDIALGNVVGSNVFNVLGILGTTALVRPLVLGGVSFVDLAVMMVAAVLLLPLLWTGFRLVRWEGALLLSLYVGYVGMLVANT